MKDIVDINKQNRKKGMDKHHNEDETIVTDHQGDKEGQNCR